MNLFILFVWYSQKHNCTLKHVDTRLIVIHTILLDYKLLASN